ncbi:probable glucan 1,3-beta-glucosidase A [Quercus suber]|uniref:probable glucan 1,3-beta-glucosidase A n=1 Tax=Quercus suber TaxID=58331 RepID=UPI0032DF0BA8
MKVIADLHVVQGSQNGNDHSGIRDGFQEWGDSNIKDIVAVIDFLAKRYANNPSLATIELMNESHAPGVTPDSLKNYYKSEYDAVRKYTPSAYVILSNQLENADPKEQLSFARNFNHVVIDMHYYNLYLDEFSNMNVQSYALKTVTTSNGPLSFVNQSYAAVAAIAVVWYKSFLFG